jgi:hypothetical protein
MSGFNTLDGGLRIGVVSIGMGGGRGFSKILDVEASKLSSGGGLCFSVMIGVSRGICGTGGGAGRSSRGASSLTD